MVFYLRIFGKTRHDNYILTSYVNITDVNEFIQQDHKNGFYFIETHVSRYILDNNSKELEVTP